MRIIKTYMLDVGDIFEGNGGGGYLTPIEGGEHEPVLVCSHSFVHVEGYDPVTRTVEICGDGKCSIFHLDHIADHISRGNLVYVGNINGRS